MGGTSYTKHIKTVISFLLLILIITGCSEAGAYKAGSDGKGYSEQNAKEAADMPEDSVLLYFDDEDIKALVSDMQEGKIPKECTVLYDAMGTLPQVTLTDKEEIGDIYDLLSEVVVVDDSGLDVTDAYHFVSFKLSDGRDVNFSFEGEETLCRGTYELYSVKGSEALWSYVRGLKERVPITH